MKRLSMIVLLLFSLLGSAQAQLVDAVAVGYSPRTGDLWVDARLGDINVFARGDLDGFVDDVVVSYGAPRLYVRELVYQRGWLPADVYYACAIARQLGRPCAEVADYYARNRGQGWGVVAQRLGIKPGSAAFHALKGDVGKAHGRAESRGRGKPAHAGKAGKAGSDKGKPEKGNPGKGKDRGGRA